MSQGLDRAALQRDVSAISEYLLQLSLRGSEACTLAGYQELQRLSEQPSLLGVPRLRRTLEALGRSVRGMAAASSPELSAALMDLLLDGFYTCRAVRTYLQGKFTDVAALEELFGEARPDRTVEDLRGLELLEIGYESRFDGSERRTDTSYLLDLVSGEVFAESVAADCTPRRQSPPKPPRRGKILPDIARVSPGFSPRQVRLEGPRNLPATDGDTERIQDLARKTIETIHKEYRSFRSNFFAPQEFMVFLAPKGFYADDDRVYLVDKAGQMLSVGHAPRSPYLRDAYLSTLATRPVQAVYGRLTPVEKQMVLVPLGIVVTDSRGSPSRVLL